MFQKIIDFVGRNVSSKTFKLCAGTLLGVFSGVLLGKIEWGMPAAILIFQAISMLFLHDQEEKAKAKANGK